MDMAAVEPRKMRKLRLTKPLTKEEAEVALAVGAEDLKDFVAVPGTVLSSGSIVEYKRSWPNATVRKEFRSGDISLWLFEEIEDNDESTTD